MLKKVLKNETIIEKRKEDVLKRWNQYLLMNEVDGYENYHEYIIVEHKINDNYSYLNLSENYYGYDLEFAIFDKKDNLIFITNDERKLYFFEKYELDPNINKEKFDNYIKKIENRVNNLDEFEEKEFEPIKVNSIPETEFPKKWSISKMMKKAEKMGFDCIETISDDFTR
ncbi:MAG: hypothetical protein OHM56_03060 [Spiroplasma phoeniceum]|nr:MAG: hypothetical protein OHM57_02510 [Spiroplasma phoeniceum]UZQ32945.1 MAG: hypothetical protein OHM56_03060 [Spiroplasma phoeniceum]